MTRLQADNLVFEANVDGLRIEGYPLKSIIMKLGVYGGVGLIWAGVRLIGWLYWKK